VLTALVNNIQGLSQNEFENSDPYETEPITKSIKPHIERAFSESQLFLLATEGKTFLENSGLKFSSKVLIFNDIGMVKLEFSINCLEISPLTVENLGLTYDSTLSVNLLYDPDVFFTK